MISLDGRAGRLEIQQINLECCLAVQTSGKAVVIVVVMLRDRMILGTGWVASKSSSGRAGKTGTEELVKRWTGWVVSEGSGRSEVGWAERGELGWKIEEQK